MSAPIVIVSGPPAAGKSTLCRLLAAVEPKGMQIPVDDIREWVVAGIAHPIPDWTEETAHQFELAESAAADIARRYSKAGFRAALDHCRLPENIEKWAARDFHNTEVFKVALLPPLETILERNRTRTNKAFDPTILEPAITSIHKAYTNADLKGWMILGDDSTLEEWLNELMTKLP